MAFVGLVPSEHSSGTKRARGGITKTGNAHLRRVLVEVGVALSPPSVRQRDACARASAAPRPAVIAPRVDARSNGSIVAISGSPRAANPNNTSSPPSPASSPASSGPR